MSQDTSAMEIAEGEVSTPDPDFIIYLLDPEQDYNCYFVVGNPSLEMENIERIGVVKKMLLAHSVVLRAELQDSKIAEKNDVQVIDIFPQTFKNLLRFVYGFDNTQDLGFDEADNLLYAAEKYMMPKLKNRLASRLMSLLDYSNICSLMNNPACYSVLELNSKITEILQLETDQVLASPNFLDLSSDGFLRILEQEMCNVPEIGLWKAAINWAKRQAKSNTGKALRKKLSPHLQLIRVCSLTYEDLVVEVVPTKVLTYDEIVLVGESQRTKEVQPNLTTICNIVEERDRPLVKSELMHQTLTNCNYYGQIPQSTIKLRTQDVAIELCFVQICSYNMNSHQCNCTISIEKDMEPPVVVRFEGQLDQPPNWTIPILVDEKNVQLSPNSSYSIKCSFSCSFYNHSSMYGSHRTISGTHFCIDLENTSGYYCCQLIKIGYKTITKKLRSIHTQ